MQRVETSSSNERLSWAEIAGLVGRYRTVILITFIAVVLGAYCTLQFMTEQYESQSSLLVKLGRENIELPTTVQTTGIVATGLRPEELASEIQILHSRALLEQVVDELGPQAFAFAPPPPHGFIQTIKFNAKKIARWGKQRYNDLLIALNLKKRLTEREAAIVLLEDTIEAAPEKGSDVIGLTVRLPSADLAVRVEQVLLRRYFEERTALRRTPTEQQFFSQELDRQAAALHQLEMNRAQLLKTYQISSVPEQRSILLKELGDMETELNSDQKAEARIQQEQGVMQQRLSSLPESSQSSVVQSPNPSVQAFRERLSELEVEHVRLASRYQPGAEPLKRVEEEIASVQSHLNSEPATLLGSTVAETNPVKRQFVQSTETNKVTLAGIQAQQQQLRAPMQKVNGKLTQLNEGERKLADIDRELKLAQDSYLKTAERSQEAQLHGELDQSHIANVNLISPPSQPIEPVAPRKLLIMAVSFPVGLLLGGVLALLLHYMDDTIRDADDLLEIEGVEFLGHYKQPAERDDVTISLLSQEAR